MIRQQSHTPHSHVMGTSTTACSLVTEVSFSLANRMVLDRFGPHTSYRGGTVQHRTVRFRTVPRLFTLQEEPFRNCSRTVPPRSVNGRESQAAVIFSPLSPPFYQSPLSLLHVSLGPRTAPAPLVGRHQLHIPGSHEESIVHPAVQWGT